MTDTAPAAAAEANPVADAFLACLARSKHVTSPFDYWLLEGALPDEDVTAIAALPFAPPKDTIFNGKRETNNATRVYFNKENQDRFEVCRRVVAGFQDARVRRAIEEATGADLSDGHLRIEYCQDTEGFWLEPHTDIFVKKFTMLVYLSDDPRLKAAGTDVHEGPPEYKYLGSAPYGKNLGVIFIPGPNTWHAVGKRPLNGAIRKAIIINFVTSDWRDKYELA
ncbi:MAG: 2OG-Fe(II) oxygenase [Rhodomicrobium sp.]